EKPNEVAHLDPYAGLDPARDRGQVEVLREDGAAAVGDAHVEAAVLFVGAALHAFDDAVVGGVDRLAPDFAADVDAAVAVAALGRAVAGALGAEDAAVADGHAARRTVERMEPGVGADLGQPLPLGRRPARAEHRRLGRRGGRLDD